MFGHQDDKKDDDEQSHNAVVAPDEPAENTAPDQHEQSGHGGDTPAADTSGHGDDAAATGNPEGDADSEPATDTGSTDDTAWQHPGEPLADEGNHSDGKDDKDNDAETGNDDGDDKNPGPISDIIAPAGGSAPPTFRPASPSSAQDNSDSDNTPHELIDIKQKALTDLAPLMGQLDQEPEDKFRTLMMMIQASDDQSLIKEAFAAAEAIKDEKARAQALLDIVNEINYFTQHPEN